MFPSFCLSAVFTFVDRAFSFSRCYTVHLNHMIRDVSLRNLKRRFVTNKNGDLSFFNEQDLADVKTFRPV